MRITVKHMRVISLFIIRMFIKFLSLDDGVVRILRLTDD